MKNSEKELAMAGSRGSTICTQEKDFGTVSCNVALVSLFVCRVFVSFLVFPISVG